MNMTENKIVANNGSSIVLYTTDDGSTQLEVKLEKETVWLTQNQMAELFGRDRTVITRHIRNIFKEGEFELFSENRCDHKAKLECEEIFFCSITELSDIRKLKELKELRS